MIPRTIRRRVPLGVEQLPIQQVQPGVEQMAAMGLDRQVVAAAHCPAPVTIISGIAANEAARMMTRYTEPSMLVSLPLVLSPMY